MSRLVASSLTGWLFAALTPLAAQTPDVDPLTRHVPAKPATRQELDHVEAVKLYGRGVALEHQNRLIEATRTFEQAQRLDPDSAAISRALVPLYFALDRLDDALSSCRRVLELTPDDFEIGYRYARQLRVLGRHIEAIAVLTRTGECPGLKDHLEVRAQVFYDLGMLLEEKGELDKAEKALREVLTILDNPAALLEQGPYNRDEIVTQAAETHERLGKLYLRSKKTAQAIAEFQTAQKDPLRSARLSFNLAQVHVSQGQPDKALEQVEQYLRSQPQGMDGYELRIKLQKQLGNAQDILPSLERSAAADRNNQSLQLLLAREYRRAGRSKPAQAIYLKLLEQAPTPEVYRGLFRLYKDMNGRGADLLLTKLDDAIGQASGDDGSGKKVQMNAMQREAAQRAAVHVKAILLVLRDDPDLVKLLLPAAAHRLNTRAGLRFTTSSMLAELAGRARLFDQAEMLYRHCLRVGRENEAQIYLGLLRVLSLAHKNQEIISVCQQGLKTARNTNRALFLSEMASAYMSMNQVDESLKAADEAVQTANSELKLSCRIERVQLLSQAAHHPQAIAECQALLKEYNQAGDVHKVRYVLSAIYSAAQQPDKAEEQLLLILKDDPDAATANNDLGYLWADQNKKLEEAEKRIRRALELDKQQRNSLVRQGLDSDRDNAAFVDSLGWVLFRKGDWQAARRELEKAASLPVGDDDPVVWDHLGDVCFRLKEIEKAGSAWRKAIELYESGGRRRPDDRYREIKEKLKHLD